MILVVSEFMLRSDQNGYGLTQTDLLDLWRERYQEEIIGREDSLAAFVCSEHFVHSMKWMDTKKLELGFQSLLKTNTMVQHSTI